MAKRKRDIGQEILDGLREIKNGKHGRIINIPDASSPARLEKISAERKGNIKQS